MSLRSADEHGGPRRAAPHVGAAHAGSCGRGPVRAAGGDDRGGRQLGHRDEDAWVKQVLVVMAYSDDHADKIETAWAILDSPAKADTIVYVVVTNGSDLPIYGASG